MKVLFNKQSVGYMITSWFNEELTSHANLHFMFLDENGKLYNCGMDDAPTVFLKEQDAKDALAKSLAMHNRNFGERGPSKIVRVAVRH